MKNKTLTLLLIILILLLSSLSVYYSNLIIFLIAFIIYLTLIITKVIFFYRLNKKQNILSISSIVMSFIFLVILGSFLLFMKDLFMAKGSSRFTNTVIVNQKEIERNGGAFKYDEYMLQLKEAALPFSKQSDSIKFQNKYYEYLAIKHEPKNYKYKIIIVATFHGDEPAGALSIPLLLKDITANPTFYQNTALYIICPMNPVGLAFTSRENENGLDLNSDFELKTQKETNNLTKTISIYKPDLLIDIHENHGDYITCLLANIIVNDNYGELLCKDLTKNNIELASEAKGRENLKPKGWSRQTTYGKLLSDIVKTGSLRRYGESINLPVIALECDQSLPIEKRTFISLSTIKACAKNIDQLDTKK